MGLEPCGGVTQCIYSLNVRSVKLTCCRRVPVSRGLGPRSRIHACMLLHSNEHYRCTCNASVAQTT